MPYGLNQETIKKIRGVFANHPEVEQVILYGSRALGKQRDASDIDLTLTGKGLNLKILSRIEIDLDDLLLPYKFDLSIRRQISNDSLLNHIDRVGILFYERSSACRKEKIKWQTKPFEDCIESVKYTRKIQRKDFLEEGLFPIVSQEAEFINGYWNNEADVFKVSTPVVIIGDHTQVLKYVDFDFVLGADGVKILPPRDFLRPKFFFYQLQAANFTSLGYARHYRLLKELEIKYPPLAEQQRIVGLLDEAFEGIATAKANAEKNLQNARALFESHLQSVFSQRGKGWVEKRVAELVDDGVLQKPFDGNHGEIHPKKADYTPSGVPFIMACDLVNGTVDTKGCTFISRKQADSLRVGFAKDGDVLISHKGTIGRSAILKT